MALLSCPRCYRQIVGTAQEGIDEATEPPQIVERADQFRSLGRVRRILKVRPFGGDQRLAAVR